MSVFTSISSISFKVDESMIANIMLLSYLASSDLLNVLKYFEDYCASLASPTHPYSDIKLETRWKPSTPVPYRSPLRQVGGQILDRWSILRKELPKIQKHCVCPWAYKGNITDL
ncbi:hypothetical protein EVAR_9457_1 [Eumeta japonica]|uniref:Uncharacterized protein n=1 Tax=Eumeta variegata TaxID=151549 RepID=A0A4C1UDD1_EUMVA|nr:hypothetical protein EVAR_9457_1 [Eumeta japonica]